MKSGYKTTEFWLGLITVILTYLNTALGLHIPVNEVIAVISLVISYIVGRTWLKSKVAQKGQITPLAASTTV